jgi:hypothetical protein
MFYKESVIALALPIPKEYRILNESSNEVTRRLLKYIQQLHYVHETKQHVQRHKMEDQKLCSRREEKRDE